jgi:hypothetical protein
MENTHIQLKEKLEDHPIFHSLRTLDDLRVFMEHHVYAVWDFMSLLKELQKRICPSGSPWLPNGNSNAVRLVNEIVLEEESDVANPNFNNRYASHFEIYLNSMLEVGASTEGINNFIEVVREKGVKYALSSHAIPHSLTKFMRFTFDTIRDGSTHQIAASFAYGRENLVPVMFSRILKNCGVDQQQAPLFHYYLERHAHLDGEQHGPMAEELLASLTNGDVVKEKEADRVAESSIEARIKLWDGVLEAVRHRGKNPS